MHIVLENDDLNLNLELAGFGDSNDVLPVYIGDDRTDEDAFKVSRCLARLAFFLSY